MARDRARDRRRAHLAEAHHRLHGVADGAGGRLHAGAGPPRHLGRGRHLHAELAGLVGRARHGLLAPHLPGRRAGRAGARGEPVRGPAQAARALLEEGRPLDRPRRAHPAGGGRVRHRHVPGGHAARHRGGADGQLHREPARDGARGHRHDRPRPRRRLQHPRQAAGPARHGGGAGHAGEAAGEGVPGERRPPHPRRGRGGRRHRGRGDQHRPPRAAPGHHRRPPQRHHRAGRAGGGRAELRHLAGLGRPRRAAGVRARGAHLPARHAVAAQVPPLRADAEGLQARRLRRDRHPEELLQPGAPLRTRPGARSATSSSS